MQSHQFMSKNKILWSKIFPKRSPESQKGDYGRVFILAGSEGMLGAAILCSRGALRVGAGLVYLGIPQNVRDILNLATPEVIVVGGDSSQDYFTALQKANVLAIGPGLGSRREVARDLLFKLSEDKYPFPIVLDADGLNAFSSDPGTFAKLNLKLILTPHPGELARLLGTKIEEIQRNRKAVAREAAKIFNSILVLKGHQTVVADASGNLYINKTGNPGMASAGVGDVLTGMLAGLIAQGIAPWEASVAGVHLHGLAGDLAAKEKGEYGMIAGDLVENIAYAIQKIR